MSLDTLLLFTITCLSLNLIPGPDVIYIVSNAMKGGMRQSATAALGLGIGYFFHTLAACIGLSAIILSSSIAFTVVKWLGAIYLAYLGVSAIINAVKGQSKLTIDSKASNTRANSVLKQGIIVSVLNPKVALFFLSFLPQFVDADATNTTQQLLMLGVWFTVLATLCNLAYALLGGWLLQHPNAGRFTRSIEMVSGGLLLGLAGKIALDNSH